jgi:hypothetical protein
VLAGHVIADEAGTPLGDLYPSSRVITPADMNAVAAAASYPVLVLPLGGQWTDFELKASTNNFTNLCYYLRSSGVTPHADDSDVRVYFTDDYATDTRQWHRAAVATPICSQLADPSHSEVEYVVVQPSHECAVDWRGWMSNCNTRLVWSFVRYDGIDYEKNATGTKPHWNPVVPVEWRKERVTP